MKMKKLAGAVLALAGFAFGGSAFAADDGDVYEFVPVTGTVSPANAFGASSEISFKMRLLPSDYDTAFDKSAAYGKWEIAYVGAGSTNLPWIVSPLRLGVVVSGQTRGADISFPMPNGQFTDITCTYTTQFGDYAMPLRVAGDGAGTPAGETAGYFFLNSDLWVIRSPDDHSRVFRPRRRSVVDFPQVRNSSLDLLHLGGTENAYYVKTVDFDRSQTAGANVWRRTNEIGECEPTLAQLSVEGLPEGMADMKFYIWSEDDAAVTVTAVGDRQVLETRTFKDKDGVERAFTVLTIPIVDHQATYPFGVRCFGEGKVTNLVMSARCGYSFQTAGVAEPVLIHDYQTALVGYSHPPVQTLSAELGSGAREKTYPCSYDYKAYVDTFRVTLTQLTNADTKVRLAFSWKTNGVECTAFPTNFIAISAESDGGYREENLIPDMTVTIPKDSLSSPTYFVYALGSSKDIAEYGIKITPVAEDVPPGAIAATNSCRIVLAGMQPEIVQPFGASKTNAYVLAEDLRVGDTLNCRIKLHDSYRNMAKLGTVPGTADVYTVTWYRGYGDVNGITVTNDAAGGPLVSTLDSDGFGWLSVGIPYTIMATNTYHGWFEVQNPEGKRSARSWVDVNLIQRAAVSASAPQAAPNADGYFTLMESTKEYAVKFHLTDLLAAADLEELYAFLEPANAAASNCTKAAFFVGPGAKGVQFSLVTGDANTQYSNPSSQYKPGGLTILDGDADKLGENGSVAQFNVRLCKKETWSESDAFNGYDGSTVKFSVILQNHEPEFSQLVLQEVAGGVKRTVDSSVTNGEAVANSVRLNNELFVEPHKSKGWDDVAADLDAVSNKQVVVRWRIYELDGASAELKDVVYTFGKGALDLKDGFSLGGVKRIVAQIQDKDMRATNTVQWITDDTGTKRWAYYVDPEYGVEGDSDTWDADDPEINQWGPEMSFTFKASEKPRVLVSASQEGYHETAADGQPVFTEYQLVPHSGVNDPKMKFDIELEEGLKSTWVTVRVDVVATPNAGFIEPWSTNVVFYGTTKLKGQVPLLDFDGTYRDSMRNMSKYTMTAKVIGDSADVYSESAPYVFYLRNAAPVLELTGDGESQQFVDYVDSDMAYDIAKDTPVTIGWQAKDIRADLTNISITATVSGGYVYDASGKKERQATFTALDAGTVATNLENGAYTVLFKVVFDTPLTNSVTFVAKDKDGDSSEKHKIKFFIEKTRSMSIYPAKPATPSTESDDIADYFSAAGIGYGRVWATQTSLETITGFRQSWTSPSSVDTVFTYALGYAANEKESTSHAWPFVDKNGGNDPTQPPYQSPIGVDSFFYRWFTKVASDKGTDNAWTTYKPIAMVSKSEQDALSQTVIQLSWPQQVSVGTTVYSDISALAIFSREFLWSDNMGDINADGVPDSYVMKYQLTGNDYTSGADLKNVNYSEDGKTPSCQDYLPLNGLVAYSRLIPAITAYDNIKDAVAFTPRKKLRGAPELGASEDLNDATAAAFPDGVANQASVDGATPEQVYADPDLCPTSTLSRVEWLAWSEFKAAHTNATVRDWSPERPTDPTKADTDGDGITDGFEYYIWYRAHVGWIEYDVRGNEIHRRLTGRAYDPRNPGEGRFISSEEIERAFDPIVASGGADTRDTDNDGLPDIIEFEIGTDPFDFDTDGDGLPDGFEIIVAGTDPLSAHTAKDAKHDAARNYDGDAMAFTTVALEENVLPKPRFIQRYNTFATVDANGDTDGMQWYVETPLDEGVSAFAFAFDENVSTGTVFRVGEVDYVTADSFAVTADNRLAKTLTKDTYVVTNMADAAGALAITNPPSAKWVRLKPVKLMAGSVVTTNEADVGYAIARVITNAAPEKCNAAWVYGSEKVDVAGANFGFLALGRYQLPMPGDPVAELPSVKRDVAFLHYLVYQQFGFDPRTAWNENTPLAARWGKTDDVDSSAGQVSKKGYADQATRTRAFTAYDEFLLYSFFLNNGCNMSGYTAASADAPYLAQIWMAFCTNPRGVGEPAWASDEHYQGWTAREDRNENGADTDLDGVPDGWELYVMAGPKIGKDGKADPKEGKFNFAPPYAAFTAAGEEVIEMPESYFSPFVRAAQNGATDNMKYIGKDQNDSLTEFQEFEGTDSIAYYSGQNQIDADGNAYGYSTTIVHPTDTPWTWLNKFFPTDPWVPDTDDDGVSDSAEGGAFAYADAVDIAKYREDTSKTVYPGCGLNPCSVDTDGDGLPDGWESQFAGSTVSTNATEGLVDGMDGTVKDAVTSPNGPNRDYDHDGLENWQEYMTGTMRCWRYDDPFTPWGAIPFDAYYRVDSSTGDVAFSPDFDALFECFPGEKGSLRSMDDEQRWNWFWYQTLVNVGGPIYNPHLVTDQSPTAQYFTRVDVGWDPNYWDSVLAGADDPDKGACGRYYWFAHRIGRTKYKAAWSKFYGDSYDSKIYVSCSPTNEDSDRDGMDDFYELFHGLNPLLGGSGAAAFEDPADIVSSVARIDGRGPALFDNNPWVSAWPVGLTVQPPMRPARSVCDNPAFDFVVHPWKNGLQTADPDGDNERNYVEAIMAKSVFGMHTDPSPAWMTDTSYTNSLTRLNYRMPRVLYYIPFNLTKGKGVRDQNGDSVPGFTWGGVKYYFRDFDAYDMKSEGEMLEYFSPDAWAVSGSLLDARTPEFEMTSERMSQGGWMYSFEENEGYDTDHDSMGDEEEIAGRIRSATDPLDFDSPRRRQAMYFPGKDSALQTPPELIEEHPVVGDWYKQDTSFAHYTVECWARPEEPRDATVVERAVWSDGSNGGDANLVRKNFLIGTRVGEDGQCYWFTKFDSNGTGSKDEVSVRSGAPAEIGVWTHVAATYDGQHIVLYVNGQPSGTPADPWKTTALPECAVAQVLTYRGNPFAGELETVNRYGHYAIVVGASVKTYQDYPGVAFTDQTCGYAVNLYNAMGWSCYKDFFKGYVDEIRIWDGARSQADIQGSMGVRFDSETAKENRNEIYKQLRNRNFMGRYEKGESVDGLDMPAELRYHFNFDALPSAENAARLAATPQGFVNGEKAPVSRPEGYEIAWWKRVLDGYGSAYAGDANFVSWIPNTVAHLPRFDGTTYDSAFWSDDYTGDLAEANSFAHTAEPYPLWTQVRIGRYTGDLGSTLSRWYLANVAGSNSDLRVMFDFTGRHLLCEGADLLPLGGAYARYVDTMWDGQGASSMHELTGVDRDNDGLPDWWQQYAEQNYRRDVPEGEDITWDTMIWYVVGGAEIRITAAEAYKRDLAKGAYVDASGVVHPTSDERAAGTELPYVQTARSDGLIPDWWKELKKIDSEEPLVDLDRDGLNNYVEYVASELLPFRLNLDPRMASSDSKTLDYFRKVGKLYVGEMLTDHDQMEDHWERSLGDENVASASVWDALKDGEGDGWSNFAENRYNGYSMSMLAQLIAHAMGENEVLDAPIPSLKMKVRYNGDHPLAASSEEGKTDTGKTEDSAASPSIVVRAYSKNAETGSYAMNPSAEWTVRPGEQVSKEVYLGCWEDRVVRGTMAPGNVDIDSVDIAFAQILQSDLYSWTDEAGIHISRPYREFKEALDKDSSIIQNVQRDHSAGSETFWKKFENYTNPRGEASVRAVTVQRDALTQKGVIAVYGERVGTIDLTTGDFEFDMGSMVRLTGLIGTYDTNVGDAWGFKEAIFKLVYSAKVPSSQDEVVDFSLAKPDKGFVRGGLNSIEAFYDLSGNGTWDPGEPFGVVNDVEIGWAGRTLELELTDMSAVTPRVDLWSAASDRAALTAAGGPSNEFIAVASAPARQCRVSVVRYRFNGVSPFDCGVTENAVVYEGNFTSDARKFLHEGDFLASGLDIDWSHLYADAVANEGSYRLIGALTSASYLIVFDGQVGTDSQGKDTQALSAVITRRFEERRRIPTPCPERMVINRARPTFAWAIEGEDPWAAQFGTTYTAFKVRVRNMSGGLVYESAVTRMPAKDSNGIYTWTAPLSVGARTAQGVVFDNLTDYTWEVALYNAKFSTDSVMSSDVNGVVNGNPFSAPQTFRMNVTHQDLSSCSIAVSVSYAGPATQLADRIRVQAFESPDFTGDPVAEISLDDVSAEALSPSNKTANAKLIGLSAGSYFLRAYIDTNGNGVRDDWESWGYLNERDQASKPGIFNPVAVEAAIKPAASNVRKIFIEDCDTDGDWFPDVWEAERNGGEFVKFLTNDEKLGITGQGPVIGNAELIGVNPELKAFLNENASSAPALMNAMSSLASPMGVSLVSGIDPADITLTPGGFEVKSEIDPETLTVVGLNVDAANNRVILKVGAETTANVDSVCTGLFNITVAKGASVSVKIESAATPSGPWKVLEGVGGTVTVDKAGADIEVNLDGKLPAQGYFRAKIEE